MTPATQVRSPTAAGGYPSYNVYQQQQSMPYAYPPDARTLPPPLPTPFDATSLGPRRGSLVERSNPLRPGAHGGSPYPRVPSAIPEPPLEPVKKKRKRADAEQLKVLNETYNRTAFPSTEERIELAKKLGMSARSVQIWCASCSFYVCIQLTGLLHYGVDTDRFQNKRQAMRQSSRQAAASAPPTTNQPYAAPSLSTPQPAAALPQTGGYTTHSTPMGPSSVSQAGYGTPRPSSDMGGMHSASGRANPSPSPSSHRRSHEEDPHRQRFSPRSGY